MKINDIIKEDVSQQELSQIEVFANRLWHKYGIDIAFTKHFVDRVNDSRNKKPISAAELVRLFKKEYERNGKKIASLDNGEEGVFKDISTDINIPFAVSDRNNDHELVAKTIMRKKNFASSSPEFVVTEIEQIPPQDFPKKNVEEILSLCSPAGRIDEYMLNLGQSGPERFIILTEGKDIAAYAGFTELRNNRWQAKNAQTFEGHKGQHLIGKTYKFLKENGISLVSDIFQTPGARAIWSKSLPSLGLNPKIFDLDSEEIYDRNQVNLNDVYSDDPEIMHKYCWIIESSDKYPTQNLVYENKSLMPVKGLWYTDIKRNRLSEEDPCWKGYNQYGTKKKGKRTVPNCVPVSEDYDEYNDEAGMADNNLETIKRAVEGLDDIIAGDKNLPEWCQEKIAVAKYILVSVWDYMLSEENQEIDEDWQKTNKKDKTDGMSKKAVNAYRRENPGSKLKTAVTTKPSKLKKGSKDANRRKSFCARSNGQRKQHNIDCSKTPDKPICKARKRWNC